MFILIPVNTEQEVRGGAAEHSSIYPTIIRMSQAFLSNEIFMCLKQKLQQNKILFTFEHSFRLEFISLTLDLDYNYQIKLNNNAIASVIVSSKILEFILSGNTNDPELKTNIIIFSNILMGCFISSFNTHKIFKIHLAA